MRKFIKKGNCLHAEQEDPAVLYAGYEVNDDDNPARERFLNRPVFQIEKLSASEGFDAHGPAVKTLRKGLLTLRHIQLYQPARKYEHNKFYYICLFEDTFLSVSFRANLKQLHLFTPGETREVIVSGYVFDAACQLFLKVIAEQCCDYLHKYDLIRTYITQLVHLAMKNDPAE